MALYDRQIATAQRLIKKFGQPVKWLKVENGVGDPTKPWKPAGLANVDYDVFICFLPDDREGRETFAFLTGTTVPDGTLIGLMGAVNFDATIQDVVIRDGVEMRINTIDILAPNGRKILHTIGFKG